MSKKRYIPEKDIKLLYGRAAGRCAFPNCRTNLILPETEYNSTAQVGIMAHIVAHSSKGKRGDPKFPKDKLDKYDNLILLCPTCHEIVDEHDKEYTIEKLHDIKADHESWVGQQIEKGMLKFTFAELEVAIRAIGSGYYTSTENSFEVIAPDEKINKNNLSEHSRRQILMGLSMSHEVKKYLSMMSQTDPYFTEKLKNGFQMKYKELKKSFEGDSLFEAMFEFSKGGNRGFNQISASLAILCHLFQLCEVFEK